MPVPEIVHRLVDRFHSNLDAYKSGQFDEAQVRVDFINPLFKDALGWDIYNEKNRPEAYRDVVSEDRVKVGGGTKAPDYGFYIGGQRKFFLEAKKPSVGISGDVSPAVQLRRYAWSAKLPLSILTDFEELAVYDCRFEPAKDDPATTARLDLFSYEKYVDPECWKKLHETFSRDAVLNGSLDKYAEAAKDKRGTLTVDDAFLREIESWRDELARNLALRNDLNGRQLNYAVQMIIDRIIFLRMAEDRGVEDYKRLWATLDGPNVYGRLCDLFRDADDRYNSGLFHFRQERNRDEEPDSLTPTLKVDDKALRPIIKSLYYPESPYEFSVLPVDVLGQVYEQFLGKVIRLEDGGHKAIVEEKPEVRKAGGVYYTPTYIVDYIVENTVGKLVEGKKPGPLGGVRKLKIVDPACGSGSFLIGAYQYLLDWHRDRYFEDGPKNWPKQLYQGHGGQWHLTIDEKKRILLNNIYGVDIDPQAVEVTKLSLLLKVLEGESESSLATQLRMFQERALPDLDNNIKCGNSLIGSDFYDDKPMVLFDEEERYRINVFDWQVEFPQVFSGNRPGFDAVIGNPPWGADFSEAELAYLRDNYGRVIERMVDSYIYFIDRAIQVTQLNGPVGFIIPSTILNQVDARAVRKVLLTRGLSALISLGQGIFGSKVLNTSTIFVSEPRQERDTLVLDDLSALPSTERRAALSREKTVAWREWKDKVQRDPHLTFFVGKADATALLDRLRREHWLLEEIIDGKIQRGVSPDIAAAHVLSPSEAKTEALEEDLLRNSVSGAQIKRYRSWVCDQRIIYTNKGTPIDKYPNVLRRLERFRHLNTCKEVAQGKHPWWALHRPRDPRIFDSPKFIGLTTSKTIELIYDQDTSAYVTDAMYLFSLPPEVDPWSCMAILQSKPFLFLYRVANQGESRVIPQIKASKLGTLPYPAVEPSSALIKLNQLCKSMLALHEELAATKIGGERTAIQRQITAMDRRIDRLVYELYGLTDEEIAVVEEATA